MDYPISETRITDLLMRACIKTMTDDKRLTVQQVQKAVDIMKETRVDLLKEINSAVNDLFVRGDILTSMATALYYTDHRSSAPKNFASLEPSLQDVYLERAGRLIGHFNGALKGEID